MVRPRPVQRPRPPLYIGGSAEPSALRAARYGDGYLPAMPGLWEIYAAECERLGRDPGPPPPSKAALFLHVARDPDQAWEVVAPYVLYTARSNAEWAKERGIGYADIFSLTRELAGDERFVIGGIHFQKGTDPSPSGNAPTYLFSPDGFHPNTMAQLLFANEIVEAFDLKEVLKNVIAFTGSVVDAFKNLSPEVKKGIIIFSGIKRYL